MLVFIIELTHREIVSSLTFNVYHVILMVVILFFILHNGIPCWLYTRNFLIHTVNLEINVNYYCESLTTDSIQN